MIVLCLGSQSHFKGSATRNWYRYPDLSCQFLTAPTGGFLGVPLNHNFFLGFFHCKPCIYWGTPMTMETPIPAGKPPSQCQGNMTRSTSLILALPSTSAVPMADTFPWSRRVEWQVQPDIPQTLGAFEILGMLGPFKLMDLQWFSSPCVWGNRGSNPPLCSPGWIDEELVVRVRLQTSEWADKSPEPWSLERDCVHYFPIISLSFSNLKVPGWLMEMSECKGRIVDPSLSPSPCCQIPVWKAGLRYTEISSIWYIYDIDIKTLVPWWTSLVSWYSWISWHDLSPYVSNALTPPPESGAVSLWTSEFMRESSQNMVCFP